MKIYEIIDKIKAYHPPLLKDRGVDTVKFGDPDRECTGVVVTCCATVEVIRKAITLGANFIIIHEPLFWGYDANPEQFSESEVYRAKKQFLLDGGITVWRDHDLMHAENWDGERIYKDAMFDGIMRELGWEHCLVESERKPLIFKIPTIDATELGEQLKETIGLNGIRIIGDPHTKVSKVFVCEHIQSGDPEVPGKILRTEQEDFDALIPLEIIDWTLCAFLRDCCQLGKPKVLYNIGHFNFEELGMRYMAKILPSLLGDTVPVHFVQSGDSFDFII